MPIKPSQKDLIDLGLGVASGDLGKDEIKAFILNNKKQTNFKLYDD